MMFFFFFSSRRRHTRWPRDWSSDVCSSDLGSGSLRSIVSSELLDPIHAPLFDEPRTVLAMEISEPTLHFTILATLAAHKELAMGELVEESGLDRGVVSLYLQVLQDLHLVESANPIFSRPGHRRHRYRLRDSLMRFWFTYVFPNQAALNAGHDPGVFYDRVVAPQLSEFVSRAFEEVCQEWVRRNYAGVALEVGSWWGPALNALRRSGARTVEEIDIVAGHGRRVSVVGEVKWTMRQMSS